MTVMASIFAGTTMDTGLRLQRYILPEWGEIYNIESFKKPVPATLLAVATCLLLAFGAGGASGSGGLLIWPLFGTTNQLLAGLTLLVIAVMLVRRRVNTAIVVWPLTFLLLMSLAVLFLQLSEFYQTGDWFF